MSAFVANADCRMPNAKLEMQNAHIGVVGLFSFGIRH